MTRSTYDYDVIIAGGGPAGSITAAQLADHGIRTLVVEKEEFPRFHIGESLLPVGLPVLRRLGIETPSDTFLRKRGAWFIREETDDAAFFGFTEAIPGNSTHAWQVDRSRFDKLLLDHAVKLGAELDTPNAVVDFSADDDGATVTLADRALRSRYFIDATGQGRFLARRFKSLEPIRSFGKAAVFTHFHGVNPDAWDEFAPHFDIRIMITPDGWGWVIPIPERSLSVGIVSRSRGIRPEWLDEHIEQSPAISRWVRDADRRGETHVISNFNYKNTRSFGQRFVCVGDSSCFLDPVFSSGVSLGIRGADSVAATLKRAFDTDEGALNRANLMQEHAEEMTRAYDTFEAIIDRFYHTNFIDNMLFGAPEDGDFRAGVTSVLAGDVFRNDNEFQNMLLASRRRRRQSESPSPAS